MIRIWVRTYDDKNNLIRDSVVTTRTIARIDDNRLMFTARLPDTKKATIQIITTIPGKCAPNTVHDLMHDALVYGYIDLHNCKSIEN